MSIKLDLSYGYCCSNINVFPFSRIEENRSLEATYCGNLNDMLPLCDYIVISCPLTEETTGLIGHEQFKLMKKSSILINIGRGKYVSVF